MKQISSATPVAKEVDPVSTRKHSACRLLAGYMQIEVTYGDSVEGRQPQTPFFDVHESQRYGYGG